MGRLRYLIKLPPQMDRESVQVLAEQWREAMKRPGWRDIIAASGFEVEDFASRAGPSPAFIARARARHR